MCLIPNRATPKKHIMAPALHSNRIITVINNRVRDRHVRSRNIEPISIKRKATTRAIRIDNRIRYLNSAPPNLHIPPNRLPRLEKLHAAIRGAEIHQVRPARKPSPVRGIRVPPRLPVRVDPAVRDVAAADVFEAGALEGEPEEACGAGYGGGGVEEGLHCCYVLREVEVAV